MANEFTQEQKQWIKDELKVQMDRLKEEWLKQWIKEEIRQQLQNRR